MDEDQQQQEEAMRDDHQGHQHRRRRRWVRFNAERDEIHLVANISEDIFYDGATNIWLTEEDFSEMRREEKMTLKIMSEGANVPGNVCTRGLESRSILGSMKRRVAVMDGFCAVMFEQDRQKASGIADPERIRVLYSRATEKFAHEALQRAHSDAKAAALDFQEETSCDSMSSDESSSPSSRKLGAQKKKLNVVTTFQRLMGLSSFKRDSMSACLSNNNKTSVR